MIVSATASQTTGAAFEIGPGMQPLLFPTITAALSGAVAFRCGWYPSPASPSDALAIGSAIASVAGTMLGFVLAALAVVASINNTHLVSMMKRTGHYRDLLLTLFVGGVTLLLCLLCGFSLLFGVEVGPKVGSVIVALHMAALACLLDIGRKFWMVLANLRAED